MKALDAPTSVVVLKLEHYGSLGIVRSLGRMNIPVHGVDVHPDASAFLSRFCSGRFIWDIDNAPPEQSVEFLLDVGKRIGGNPLLIPTSDETALFVSENAGLLSERFLVQSPYPRLIRALCSKKEMYFLAQKHSVPTPRTLFPDSERDVMRYSEVGSFPVMLKGIHGSILEKKTGRKMAIVRTPRELLDAYIRMEDPSQPNLMLQEYIPGGEDSVWMFNGYFNQHGECLAAFTGRKLRQNPVYTGMTSLGVCLWNEELVKLVTSFARAIGYKGILDIDFRYDARDGMFKILDVNPRVGATFRLFLMENGLDVVRAFYRDATGQPVETAPLRHGRKWIVEDKDLLSSYHYYRDGTLSLPQWLSSFRHIEEAGYFALDDPLPCLAMWTRHIKRTTSQLTKRLGQRKESIVRGNRPPHFPLRPRVETTAHTESGPGVNAATDHSSNRAAIGRDK